MNFVIFMPDEMRAEVELKPSGGTITGGVVCGLDRMDKGRSIYIATQSGGQASVYGAHGILESKRVKPMDRYILTIQVWDYKLTAYVNGELVDEGREFKWDLNPSSPAQVGLAAYGSPPSDSDRAVLFHNVQARSLEEAPSPPEVQASGG